MSVLPKLATKPPIHFPLSSRITPLAPMTPDACLHDPSTLSLNWPVSEGSQTRKIWRVNWRTNSRAALHPFLSSSKNNLSISKAKSSSSPNTLLLHHFQIYEHVKAKAMFHEIPDCQWDLVNKLTLNQGWKSKWKNCELRLFGRNKLQTLLALS